MSNENVNSNKKLVQSVFLSTSQNVPNAIAIFESNQSISYAALNKRVNQLAWGLVAQGINKGDVVGLSLPVSIDYVTALLAVLKVGGIFMPLDLDIPEKRLAFILAKTTPKLIISQSTLLALLSDDSAEPDNKVDGDDSAYIIFTSGSTGLPKAIEGQHKGLSHFIHWEIKEFAVTSACRVSWLAPPTFDVSLRDIFVPLLSGGTLVIPNAQLRNNPAHLLTWLAQSKISLMHCVPSLFRLLLKELQQSAECSLNDLQTVLLAGEPLYGKDVMTWRTQVGERVELVNLYGPSETTLAKAYHRICDLPTQTQAMIPIGQPIANSALLIIKGNRLCDIGEIGEIYIKTPFRSKGYYGDAELTQTVFVQNPLHSDSVDIVYKTGDSARYLVDHSVEFLGRLDNQVKINGVRIELAEIELAVLQHEAIEQTVVITQADAQQDKVLVCYVVAKQLLTNEALREHCQQWLPTYMLPAFFVTLTEFPLNLHGKIDRKALPKPNELIYAHHYQAPENAIEARLVTLWQQLLGLEKVGVTHSFMELGGDSLKAMRLIAGIYRELNADISLRDFFAQPTIRQLAHLISASTISEKQSIAVLSPATDYAVSHAQKRLWLMTQMHVDSVAYNLPEALLIEGELHYDALHYALHAVVQRHEILRTRFIEKNGLPRQQVADDAEVNLTIVDLRSATDAKAQALAYVHKDLQSPFDLQHEPLFRVSVLQLHDTQQVLLFNIHHIISDGWSLGVLTKELLMFYHAFIAGQNVSLAPLRIQYKDYAAWQNTYLKSEEADKHRQYWLEKLSGELPVLDFPSDYARPALQTFDGDTLHFTLANDKLQAFNTLLREQQASLFMGLTALLKTLLYRYTGQHDLLIGTPVAGRVDAELENQLGFYVNTLVLRDVLDAKQSFATLLAQIKTTTTEAFDHQLYPFDVLVDELAIARDMSRSPLFDVMLVLQNNDSVDFASDGLHISSFVPNNHWSVSRFDLVFHFSETTDGLSLDLNFNTNLFSKSRIHRLGEHIMRLLDGVLQNIHCSLDKLPLLTAFEQQVVLNHVSDSSAQPKLVGYAPRTVIEDSFLVGNAYPTMADVFEQQVTKTPEHIALLSSNQQLSYTQLNQLANQLSHQLIARVVKQNVVAVYSERVDVVALLACLKAGLIYLPIDTSLPLKRIEFMLAQSNCELIIHRQHTPVPESLQSHYSLLAYDEFTLACASTANPERLLYGDDIAYLLYTSGSTGQPKAVLIKHEGFINMALAQIAGFSLMPSDRVLQFASIAFDASLSEVFMALFSGATLVLTEAQTITDTTQFIAYLNRQGITHLTLPPVYLRALQRQPLTTLKVLITAGEAAQLEDALYYAQHCAYFNAYGPTETSVCASFYRVDAQHRYTQRIPIGQAIANTAIYVLDDTLNPVPIGVVGEIYIAGMGVAKGYLYQAELTAASFVSIPQLSTTAIYKTGDLGCWNEAGQLEYIRRKDEQVKVSGYRIETAEVAYHLNQHAVIAQAVVYVQPDNQGQQSLVAYFTRISAEPLSIAQLRAHLSEVLPAYMIPAHFIELAELPLNASGKVDKKALPLPDADSAVQQAEHYVAPSNDIEQQLVDVWQDVLNQRPIGIHDHYFHCGGDSIRAIQIIAQLRERHLNLEVRDIFQYPTIYQLAQQVHLDCKVVNQQPVTGIVPLTPVQHWFLAQKNPAPQHFNQAVLLKFPVGTLQMQFVQMVLQQLQDHHDALRTRYILNGTMIQEITASGRDVSLLEMDCKDCADPLAVMQEHANAAQASIDLSSGYLFHAVIYRHVEQDALLLFCHHLVIDGVSWRILLADFSRAYEQLLSELPITLPAKTDSFKTHAQRLIDYAHSVELNQQLPYWRSLVFIARMQKLNQRTACFADAQHYSFNLSQAETSLLLTNVHRAFNTRIDDVLLAALAMSFYSWRGQAQLLIELEGHGRDELSNLSTERTVGWFTVAYPHLLFYTPQQDLATLLKNTKESLRKVPQKGLGYGVLRYLSKHTELMLQPEVGFNYLGQFETVSQYGLFSIDWQGVGQTVSPKTPLAHDLDFLGMVNEGKLQLHITYNQQQYSATAIQKLADLYRQSLLKLISFCTDQDGGELTPSDLTYSNLSMTELDLLFSD